MAINANLGKASIAIRATLDELDKDLEGARGKTSSAISKIVGEAGATFATLGNVVMGGVAIATGAIAGLTYAGIRFAEQASEYVAVGNAFEDMSSSVYGSADDMVGAIANVTSGMVDNETIMHDLGLSYAMFGKDIDDFGTSYEDMWERSAQIARAKGMDVEQIQSAVARSIASGNMAQLRNLGIMIDLDKAYDDHAEVLGTTVGELTEAERTQARYNAVMEQTEGAFGDIEVGAATFADQLQRVRVWASNLTLEIGRRLEPVLARLVENVFPLLEGVVDSLMPHLESFLDWVNDIINPIADFFGHIEAGVAPGLAFQFLLEDLVGVELAATILEWVDKIRDFIAAAWDVIQPIMEWIGENVGLIDVLIALGAALMFAVALILGPVLLAIGKIILVFVAVTAAVAALRNAWESNFLGIQDIVSAVITFVSNFIETAVSGIRTFWENNGEAILASAQAVWETIQSVIETVVGRIEQIIEVFTLAKEGEWREFGEALRDIWDESWDAIIAILGTAWETISGIVADLVQDIISFFTETDWGEVGKAIIEGIANGITGAVGLIRDAARDAAQNALDAAKGFLGIGSPSKRSGKEIGAPWVAGIAQRIERDMKRFGRELPQMMDVMVSPQLVRYAGSEPAPAVTNINVDAHYRHQDEVTMRDDVRFVQLMAG